MTIVIEAWVDSPPANPDDEAGATVADKIDRMAAQIEAVMHADPFLPDLDGNPTCFQSILTGTDIQFDDEGKNRVALLTMTYAVTYHTLAPAPPDLDDMNDFASAGTEWNLEGQQDPDDRWKDNTEIPTDDES